MTRPRTTLAFAIVCAVTIAIGGPVLRALGHGWRWRRSERHGRRLALLIASAPTDRMLTRFHELTAMREHTITSGPRAERDRLIVTLTAAQQCDYAAHIKAHEAELYDINLERAVWAPGKTGLHA